MHRLLMKHMIAPRSQKIFLKFGKLKSKHANFIHVKSYNMLKDNILLITNMWQSIDSLLERLNLNVVIIASR